MTFTITITFCVIAGLVVVWACAMAVRCHLRWRRASRSLNQTIAKVRRQQALLAAGLVPEFEVEGDIKDLKRRYLAGEDIPLRWRQPRN